VAIIVRFIANEVFRSLFILIRIAIRSVIYVILRGAARWGIAPWVVALAASIAGVLLVFLMVMYLVCKEVLTASALAWLSAIVMAWLIAIVMYRGLGAHKHRSRGCVHVSLWLVVFLFTSAFMFILLYMLSAILSPENDWLGPLVLLSGTTVFAIWLYMFLRIALILLIRLIYLWGVAQWFALIAGALLGFATAILMLLILSDLDSLGWVAFTVLVAFLGGWAISTFLLLREAPAVSKVVSRAFLLGAAQSVVLGVASMFPILPTHAIDAAVYIVIAIGMTMVCLLGCGVTFLFTGLWRKRARG